MISYGREKPRLYFSQPPFTAKSTTHSHLTLHNSQDKPFRKEHNPSLPSQSTLFLPSTPIILLFPSLSHSPPSHREGRAPLTAHVVEYFPKEQGARHEPLVVGGGQLLVFWRVIEDAADHYYYNKRGLKLSLVAVKTLQKTRNTRDHLAWTLRMFLL